MSLGVLLTGCAYIPQKANINPTVTVAPSQVGNGVNVAVLVLDERPSTSLGRRASGYGPAAEITSAEEIAVIIQREISRGLQAKGFTTSTYQADAATRLTVEERLLEYSTSTGFFTGGIHINGALKSRAEKGSKSYEKMYRSAKEERVLVVPTGGANEKWINGALSDVLNQLLNDTSLINFLANPK